MTRSQQPQEIDTTLGLRKAVKKLVPESGRTHGIDGTP